MVCVCVFLCVCACARMRRINASNKSFFSIPGTNFAFFLWEALTPPPLPPRHTHNHTESRDIAGCVELDGRAKYEYLRPRSPSHSCYIPGKQRDVWPQKTRHGRPQDSAEETEPRAGRTAKRVRTIPMAGVFLDSQEQMALNNRDCLLVMGPASPFIAKLCCPRFTHKTTNR